MCLWDRNLSIPSICTVPRTRCVRKEHLKISVADCVYWVCLPAAAQDLDTQPVADGRFPVFHLIWTGSPLWIMAAYLQVITPIEQVFNLAKDYAYNALDGRPKCAVSSAKNSSMMQVCRLIPDPVLRLTLPCWTPMHEMRNVEQCQWAPSWWSFLQNPQSDSACGRGYHNW